MRTSLRDDALRTQLDAVIRDRTDPALAAALSRLDAATAGCDQAIETTKAGIAKLSSPLPP